MLWTGYGGAGGGGGGCEGGGEGGGEGGVVSVVPVVGGGDCGDCCRNSICEDLRWSPAA